jgi:putative transcriptional regulator
MTSLAGSFLVARPTLRDPNFIQTVILLIQHNSEGAFGLVVNRRVQVEGFHAPVYIGGPCELSGMFLLHGHPEWTEEKGSNSVAPGIFLGDTACMSRVKHADADAGYRFRIFAGYAGWGADQLEGELAAGAWAVIPANGQLLFDESPEDLWRQLVPSSIPKPSAN